MLLQIPQVEKDIMIARSHGKASKRKATSSQAGKVAAVPISASTKKDDPNSPRMAREKARDATKKKKEENEAKAKEAKEPAQKKLKMGKKK